MAINSIITKDPASLLKKVQVLIVDNNVQVVMLLMDILKKLGFGTTHAAHDGYQAVEVLRKHKVDLLITDWELKPVSEQEEDSFPKNTVIINDKWEPVPPANGANFLKFLRGSKKSPNPYLSVIMLTGQALRDNIEYARDSGVNEIIIKPITADTLCGRIIKVIEDERPFITAPQYKGPCRRRKVVANSNIPERRVHDVKVIKFR